MLNPTYQPMLTEEKLNINLKNASEAEMTKSFSSSHGIFCFCWKIKNQMQSLWSKNIGALLRIFFSIKRGEIIYFPPEGKEIVVFRRAI